MRSDSPLWRVMGDAAQAQAQEAEALAKVRDPIPDDGIARAWANVTLTDGSGRLGEVDVLLLTRAGLTSGSPRQSSTTRAPPSSRHP